MPALFTHCLCGQKMLSLVNNPKLIETVSAYRQVFNLGTQGPDFFFFHLAKPWSRKEKVKDFGERLHNENVMNFFSVMLDYIMNNSDKELPLLASYLYGYTCHYALDLNTHPYIFYKTGFVRSGELPHNKFVVFHRQFETAIDVLMLKRIMDVKPYTMNAPELIRVNNLEARAVSKMYEYALNKVFEVKVYRLQIEKAISNFRQIETILRDKQGIRKKIISLLEDLLGKQRLISSLIYPPEIHDDLDYLNLKHLSWSFPWDISMIRTDSFIDMFDYSANEAAKLCEQISFFIENKNERANTLAMLGNRSFSTGIDCLNPVKFEHHDCVFVSE